MVDISTVWVADEVRGDWQMSGADLASGNDLNTAAFISLFTDRVAGNGDTIPDGTTDPRGWWADNQPSGNTVAIGSRLWLLSRRKATQQTLNDATTYAREALQWMIDDGVAVSIDIVTQWQGLSFLAMQVTINRKNGTQVALNYKWAWDQVN